MTTTEKYYEHHMQVILNALPLARPRGSLVDTVHLSGLYLEPHRVKLPDPWHYLELYRDLRVVCGNYK